MGQPGRLAAAAAAAFTRLNRVHPVHRDLHVWNNVDCSSGHVVRSLHGPMQGVLGTFSVARISSPFLWLQSRSSSGSQDGDQNREEALEKLKGLVDGWVLEGEADIEKHVEQPQQKLASTPGLVDAWNLEDWHDPEMEFRRGETRSLVQELSQVMEAREITPSETESPKPRVKKVIGMDKILPSRVLVEFSEAANLANITADDLNKLYRLSKEDEARFFSEGLPSSYVKEFDVSGANGLLIRSQFLKLVEHFTNLTETKDASNEVKDEIVEKAEFRLIEHFTSLNQRKKLARERRLLEKADLGSRKQIVLDGLPGSGKSVILSMLVHWARSKGWLVCYIPSARKWTDNGFYYKNDSSGLWDTPVQATSMLQDFMNSHGDMLDMIPCRISDPIPLGEGPGIGRLTGVQEAPIREGATLKHLVHFGIVTPHAAVGVVVRLRKELSLVEELPVLIAIDEFNSWFTFSAFHESLSEFKRKQIHAKELAMVNAYRDMTYGPFMIGAFSHTTNVGKLPKQLPTFPYEAKVFVNRFDFWEASIMLKHYIRKWSPNAKFGKRARRAIYMLTNGNATEIRDIACMTAGGMRQRPEQVIAASA